jgi:hypothetical protein
MAVEDINDSEGEDTRSHNESDNEVLHTEVEVVKTSTGVRTKITTHTESKQNTGVDYKREIDRLAR